MKVKHFLDKEELDAFISFKPENIFYITGLPSSQLIEAKVALFIQSEEEITLLIPKIFAEEAQQVTNIDDIRFFSPQEDSSVFVDLIVKILKEKDLDKKIIGLELDYISANLFEILKKELTQAGFKDFSKSMYTIRTCKDSFEVKNIRTGIEIIEKGIRTAIEIVKPGLQEIEVAAEVESAIRRAGAKRRDTEAIVKSGSRSAIPYISSSNKKIEENEPIIIKILSNYNEYFSKISRPIFTGKPDEKLREMFKSIAKIHETVLETIRPEISVGEIDKITRKIMKENGYEKYLILPTGHGIGLEKTEPPIIIQNNQTVLKPNTVIYFEPAITIPNTCGMMVGDMVLITEDGCELLNKLSIETV